MVGRVELTHTLILSGGVELGPELVADGAQSRWVRPSRLATERALVMALGALIATKIGVSPVQMVVGHAGPG
jgi:hypothetical protein